MGSLTCPASTWYKSSIQSIKISTTQNLFFFQPLSIQHHCELLSSQAGNIQPLWSFLQPKQQYNPRSSTLQACLTRSLQITTNQAISAQKQRTQIPPQPQSVRSREREFESQQAATNVTIGALLRSAITDLSMPFHEARSSATSHRDLTYKFRCPPSSATTSHCQWVHVVSALRNLAKLSWLLSLKFLLS